MKEGMSNKEAEIAAKKKANEHVVKLSSLIGKADDLIPKDSKRTEAIMNHTRAGMMPTGRTKVIETRSALQASRIRRAATIAEKYNQNATMKELEAIMVKLYEEMAKGNTINVKALEATNNQTEVIKNKDSSPQPSSPGFRQPNISQPDSGFKKR